VIVTKPGWRCYSSTRFSWETNAKRYENQSLYCGFQKWFEEKRAKNSITYLEISKYRFLIAIPRKLLENGITPVVPARVKMHPQKPGQSARFLWFKRNFVLIPTNKTNNTA